MAENPTTPVRGRRHPRAPRRPYGSTKGVWCGDNDHSGGWKAATDDSSHQGMPLSARLRLHRPRPHRARHADQRVRRVTTDRAGVVERPGARHRRRFSRRRVLGDLQTRPHPRDLEEQRTVVDQRQRSDHPPAGVRDPRSDRVHQGAADQPRPARAHAIAQDRVAHLHAASRELPARPTPRQRRPHRHRGRREGGGQLRRRRRDTPTPAGDPRPDRCTRARSSAHP